MRYINLKEFLTLKPSAFDYIESRAAAYGDGWLYFKPTEKCRTGACLVAILDTAIVAPKSDRLLRWSSASPLVWRSDAPLGAYSLAGIWCAMSLRKTTGCAVFIVDRQHQSQAVFKAEYKLVKAQYLIGLELPWTEYVSFNLKCGLGMMAWVKNWGWTLAPTNSFQTRENTDVLRIGIKVGKPAFAVSTGHLHGGTRAETLNLDHLMWTHKTLLEMLTHKIQTE